MKIRDDFFSEGSGGGSSSDGPGYFLKMASGSRIKMTFGGEIYYYRRHWVNGNGVGCPGSGCEHCKNNIKVSERFRVNVIHTINGQRITQCFDSGKDSHDKIKALSEAGYDITNHLFIMSREGEGTDTKYNFVAVKDGDIPTAMQEDIAAMKLLNLVPKELQDQVADKAEAVFDEPVFDADDDITF